MKISKETITVMKNFSNINGGIKFEQGNVIRVSSIDKSIIGTARVSEEFPVGFAIYDMPQFLSVLSMFDEPELDFDQSDEYVRIFQGKQEARYFFCEENCIVAAPYDKELPGGEDAIFITDQQLKKLSRASNIMKLPDFALVKEGDSIDLIVEDSGQDAESQNNFTLNLNFEIDMSDFELSVSAKSLNFVDADYSVDYIEDFECLVFNTAGDKYDITYHLAVTAI